MGGKPYRCRPRVERLRGDAGALDLAEAFSRLRGRVRPCFLDSAAGAPRRFSLLAFDPLPEPPPTDLPGMRATLAALEPAGGDAPPPWFRGGFLGALAYDLGVVGEELDLPPEPWGLPLVVGGLYVDYLVRDHAAGETLLVLGEEPGDERPALAERRAAILDALARPFPRPTAPFPTGPLVRTVAPAEHRRRIDCARDQIAAGEIYQANLTHRFTRGVHGDPVDLYLRLRRLHPGPYLGYLAFDGGALLCGSPELLLEVDPRTGVGRTRPIKGTARRGANAEEDRRRADGLLASAKDRAELAMIVDLERNDLGRVARPGGVRVGDFPRLESYATVHHLVADVEADLAPGVDALRALTALFPGGSVTGAPKLRSMEVIAELEGEGRGFAYGALLGMDLAGELHANLTIRTLIWRPAPGGDSGEGEVSFRVGGGITWGSSPHAEDEESLAKGEALARALDGPADGPLRDELDPAAARSVFLRGAP